MSGREIGTCVKKQSGWSPESKVEVVWDDAGEIDMGPSFVLIQKRETDQVCVLRSSPWEEEEWLAPGQDWMWRDHVGCYFPCPGERGWGWRGGWGEWKGSGLKRKMWVIHVKMAFETMCVNGILGKSFTMRRDDLLNFSTDFCHLSKNVLLQPYCWTVLVVFLVDFLGFSICKITSFANIVLLLSNLDAFCFIFLPNCLGENCQYNVE